MYVIYGIFSENKLFVVAVIYIQSHMLVSNNVHLRFFAYQSRNAFLYKVVSYFSEIIRIPQTPFICVVNWHKARYL